MKHTAANCQDCGWPLDAFGCCPKADPEEMKLGAAPVFCHGRPALEISATPMMIAQLLMEIEWRNSLTREVL